VRARPEKYGPEAGGSAWLTCLPLMSMRPSRSAIAEK
jgi:hypothetical protein